MRVLRLKREYDHKAPLIQVYTNIGTQVVAPSSSLEDSFV
jgi:hypothetical protein